MTQNNKSREEVIKELEDKAASILKEKRAHIPRRPIIIEFCGTPKSGKTTCINALNIFLKRNGFKTYLLAERASVCPITDKHNPRFNLWTVCAAIAETLYVCTEKNKELDVIILDRGIFDALCWFEWLYSEERLNKEDFISISNFLTKNSCIPTLDIVYIFDVNSEESMKREYANLLTNKNGSIMNKKTLCAFSESIQRTIEKFNTSFSKIKEINTTEKSPNDVNYEVTSETLSIISDMVEEKIGYVNLESFENFSNKSTFRHSEIDENIKLEFAPRSDIERDDTKLQIIPIVAITSKDCSRIYVVRKSPKVISDESAEKDKTLGYIGGHIRKEDATKNCNNFLATIKIALSREVREEVRQNFSFDEDNPLYIWDKSTEKSKRHLAVLFHKKVDFDNIKLTLDKDEFVSKSNSKKSGQILTRDELSKEKLEFWTSIIMREILVSNNNQLTLLQDNF